MVTDRFYQHGAGGDGGAGDDSAGGDGSAGDDGAGPALLVINGGDFHFG